MVAATNEAMSILTWLKFGTKNMVNMTKNMTLQIQLKFCVTSGSQDCTSVLHCCLHTSTMPVLLHSYSCICLLRWSGNIATLGGLGGECGHVTKKSFLHIGCSRTSLRPIWGKAAKCFVLSTCICLNACNNDDWGHTPSCSGHFAKIDIQLHQNYAQNFMVMDCLCELV